MLKFERVNSTYIWVTVNGTIIATIQKDECNLYTLNIHPSADLWPRDKSKSFRTIKEAQDAITTKWNEWLDKAGLQVKQ